MQVCCTRRQGASAADGSCNRRGVPEGGGLCQARRESRRSIYVVLKVAEANAEPILQRLRTVAASVKIMDSGTFMSRVQNDEALKRKREQQDEALRTTDSSLVGRLLALRGDGGTARVAAAMGLELVVSQSLLQYLSGFRRCESGTCQCCLGLAP